MDSRKSTVKEIARLAGVSIGTVDRVLHGRGGVSAGTKLRVDGIIASLEYRPNALARQLSLNKEYCIRVAIPRADQDSGYWALCLAGIERASRDLAPYRIKVKVDEFDRYDGAACRALLDELSADPRDGILLAPLLPEELAPVLERLGGRDGRDGRSPVPYAFFDCALEGASPVAAVSQDAFRGGYLAGRIASLLAPGGRRFAAINPHPGDRHIALRVQGFESFFRERGRAEVVEAECPGLEGPERRDDRLSVLFSAGEGFDGALVANSQGHAVAEWLADRGGPRPALLSWDLVPANARALREGKLDCVVSQRPAEQAREALERLFRAVVHGDQPDGPAVVPLEVYFKENLPPEEGG
jgi:LacI family transcriptional regulator